MDELAAAARADPVEFRLRYLDDPRAQAVVRAAAQQAGWQTRPSPAPSTVSGGTRGRGIAYAQYDSTRAYVATIAEVVVDRTTGDVDVQRVTVAHDCGLIVNPDGLRNQIEGNVLQSLSRSLYERIDFDRGQVTSADWLQYPILRFTDVPEVDVVLIDRPDQPCLGAGEPASVPTAAAIANAIFDAVGIRLRDVPFTAGVVRAALALAPG